MKKLEQEFLKHYTNKINSSKTFADFQDKIVVKKQPPKNYNFRLVISLSSVLVLFISIFVIINFAKPDDEPPIVIPPVDDEAININSSNNSELAIIPIMGYNINIDNNFYSYNEEIKIDLKLRPVQDYSTCFKDGPLYIKIEDSEYYSIIGDNEVIIDDFTRENHVNNVSENPINVTFKIKATNKTNIVESINFKIKFNTDFEKLKTYYLIGENSNLWVNLDDEYFFTISDLIYMNSSEGSNLSGPSKKLNISGAKIELLYRILNQEYGNKKITKEEYEKSVIQFSYNKKVWISSSGLTNNMQYISPNIRAIFRFDEEYVYTRLNQVTLQNDEDVAEELIKILYEEQKIDENMYLLEREYISQNGTTREMYYEIANRLIGYDEIGPFYTYEYVVEKK